jgi:hypothetical protein
MLNREKAVRAAAVATHAALVVVQQGTTLPPEEEPIGLCDLPGFDPPPLLGGGMGLALKLCTMNRA